MIQELKSYRNHRISKLKNLDSPGGCCCVCIPTKHINIRKANTLTFAIPPCCPFDKRTGPQKGEL